MIEEKISNRTEFIHSFCERLTKWVTSEKNASFFTIQKNKKKLNCGDIVPIMDSVNWLSKVKFTVKYGYKHASFDKYFIPSENNTIHDLWKIAVEKAGDNAIPILIYKKPFIPTTYIFISYELYEHIFRNVICCNMFKLRYFDICDAYVFELEEFLSNVKYKTFKKAINQL